MQKILIVSADEEILSRIKTVLLEDEYEVITEEEISIAGSAGLCADDMRISRLEIQALAQRHIYLLIAPEHGNLECFLKYDMFEEDLPLPYQSPFKVAALNLKLFNTKPKPFGRKYKHLMPRSTC